MSQYIALFQAAVVFGTVILFGALGEILTQKSGSLNLGVPGVMYLGGIAGLATAFFYERSCAAAGTTPVPALCLLLSFLAAFAAAALGGLLFSFLTITLRANQNVTGLTLTIFGGGLANFFGGSLNKLAGGVGQISVAVTSGAYRTNIPALANLGWFGRIFLSHGFMVYLAIILAIVLHWFLTRTRTGLNLRAIGESPATGDAAGINVTRYKYLATCAGAAICGLGGLYYVLDYNQGIWATTEQIQALGWLALALVIFTTWKPLNAIWGAYLFGILYWLYQFLPSILGISVSSAMTDLVQMVPYVVTILVLIFVSMRRKKEDQPPAHLGLAYFREER